MYLILNIVLFSLLKGEKPLSYHRLIKKIKRRPPVRYKVFVNRDLIGTMNDRCRSS